MDGLAKLYDHFVPGYRDGVAREGADLLTPESLQKIRQQVAADPQGTLERARRAFGGVESLEDLERIIGHLDWVFENPDAAISDAVAKGPSIPPIFKFAGMETTQSFRHDPDSKKFSDDDWTGFGLNCGTQLLKRKFSGMTGFRWHDEYDSKFVYPLARNARVALFADFGTGLAHSYYIAKFIAAAKPHAAIHLGDIYYSGKTPEVAEFYDMPLFPLSSQHELWNIPGNHDYFCGGAPYFANLDARRDGRFGGFKHRQEGSYFCLDSPAFRVIAIDGEYHSGTRYTNERLQHWLAAKVAEAKTAGRSVILLSTDEPYSHGSRDEEKLAHDVTANLPPDAIDLWFWGNTHYCALFHPAERLRAKFYGSCLGHGGYQYKRLRPNALPENLATIAWAETEPRFPAWTGVRQDMGNNGFCMMQLDDEQRTVKLEYIDWTNAPRATITFARTDRQLKLTSVVPHERPMCK